MAASGHFEFCALPRVAQTFKRGVAAYFVTNTLKYQKKASNFVTRGLVTEFMILPLLYLEKYLRYMNLECRFLISRRKMSQSVVSIL